MQTKCTEMRARLLVSRFASSVQPLSDTLLGDSMEIKRESSEFAETELCSVLKCDMRDEWQPKFHLMPCQRGAAFSFSSLRSSASSLRLFVPSRVLDLWWRKLRESRRLENISPTFVLKNWFHTLYRLCRVTRRNRLDLESGLMEENQFISDFGGPRNEFTPNAVTGKSPGNGTWRATSTWVGSWCDSASLFLECLKRWRVNKMLIKEVQSDLALLIIEWERKHKNVQCQTWERFWQHSSQQRGCCSFSSNTFARKYFR